MILQQTKQHKQQLNSTMAETSVPQAEVVVSPAPIKGNKHDDNHSLFEEDKHDTSDLHE
jgi:hypothetical protein